MIATVLRISTASMFSHNVQLLPQFFHLFLTRSSSCPSPCPKAVIELTGTRGRIASSPDMLRPVLLLPCVLNEDRVANEISAGWGSDDKIPLVRKDRQLRRNVLAISGISRAASCCSGKSGVIDCRANAQTNPGAFLRSGGL